MSVFKHAALIVTILFTAVACGHQESDTSTAQSLSHHSDDDSMFRSAAISASAVPKQVFGSFTDPVTGKKVSFNTIVSPNRPKLDFEYTMGGGVGSMSLNREEPCVQGLDGWECVFTNPLNGSRFTINYSQSASVYRVTSINWKGTAVDESTIRSHTSTPDNPIACDIVFGDSQC